MTAVSKVSQYNANDLGGQTSYGVAWTSGVVTPQATPWQRFTECTVVASAYGTDAAFTAWVERSDVDPNSFTANPIRVDTAAPFSGSLTNGMPPTQYTEAAVGWWRINVTAIASGPANVSLGGKL